MKKCLTIFIAILFTAILISCGNDSNKADSPNVQDVNTIDVPESERTTINFGIIEQDQSNFVDHTLWYVSQFNAGCSIGAR